MPGPASGEWAREGRCTRCGIRTATPCGVIAPADLDVPGSRTAAAGETLFTQGDPARWLFQLRTGVVRVCIDGADGRRQVTDFILPGDRFGFPGSGTYAFTAEAVETCDLCVFDAAQLRERARRHPDFALRLAELEGGDLDRLRRHLYFMGRGTAVERVAAFLAWLAERADAATFLLPATRREIADYLALAPETVSRVLTRLARDGVLEARGQRSMTILDPARLAELGRV